MVPRCRAFVITSPVLNAALAIALLFGFLNAVGDLIEAEWPVIKRDKAEPAGSVPHISRHRREIDDAAESGRETIRREGLEAFRSER